MNEKFQAQLIQARRKQIIEAAIGVIAEHGFQRTTIKQIAQRAEVADGTIYNYFKNKDAILLGIIEMLTEAEVREMHFDEAKQIDFQEFITGYIAHRMDEVDAGFPVLKAILPETIVNPEIGRTINEQIYTPTFAIAEQFLQYLMAQGTIPDADPVIAARLFASPLLGLMFLRLIGDEHVADNWQAYTDAMVDFTLNAYAHKGRAAGATNPVETENGEHDDN